MNAYISLKLSALTPTTLAAIIANLSQNAAQGDASHATRQAIADTFAQLVASWGYDDAIELLQDAGADPEELFDIVAPPEVTA